VSLAASVPWQTQHARPRGDTAAWDRPLLLTICALTGLGLVMVGSASISIADRQTGDPFHYLILQGLTIVFGVVLGLIAIRLPLATWEKLGPALLLASIGLLAIVLIPGLGRTVNGSTRWLHLGPINVQVSEIAKFAIVVYLSGYLVRRGEEVRTTVAGFLKPMAVVAVLGLFLLAEPDFGTTVVIAATALGLMFLGGVRLWLFGVLVVGCIAAFAFLAVSSPYRLERLTAFTNPWADPFNSGYQLTQALIAFGRGDFLGVGLGGSVQKLFYMPEAHTDFLFAVLAEELGLLGVVVVIGLFSFFVWRAFQIGARAARAGIAFGSHLAFGIGLWLGMQAFINMGVNMGLLPTKGLTLPFMSYGRSSVIVVCVAVALLLRVDHEVRRRDQGRFA
jgi:cell division protein FtsW